MRIIYGHGNCTDRMYKKIFSEKNNSAFLPVQKYHGLLIKGFSKAGAEVRCFSGLPVNRSITDRKLIREKDEQEGNAYHHYITTINYPIIRHLMVFFGSFFGVLRLKKQVNSFAVCDFLNIAVSLGVSLGCKIKGIKRVAVVTDIPDMFDTGKLWKKIRNFVMRRFDGYIFLTEYMKEFIDEKSPYIVLEGHIDSDIVPSPSEASYELSTGKRIIIYAGNIHVKYGIKYFVEGFVEADIPHTELRVYGEGDFRAELEKLAERYPSVKYMGMRDNDEIVAEEQKAALLVNPRPTAPEYTKYSFPSKNMEYMVSGTPTLTTKLPGMPKEYDKYVYLIEDETVEGVARVLKEIFLQPYEMRKRKAEAAREFVLKEKSNVVQAKKIMNFMLDL